VEGAGTGVAGVTFATTSGDDGGIGRLAGTAGGVRAGDGVTGTPGSTATAGGRGAGATGAAGAAGGAGVAGGVGATATRGVVDTGLERPLQVEPVSQPMAAMFATTSTATIHGQIRRAPRAAAGRRSIAARGMLTASRSCSAFLSASRI